jgi:lactoylglutathione lyase
MNIEGIDHIQLAMPNGHEDTAREFYCGKLEIPEVSKPPELAKRGGVWFENSRVKVHLGVDPDFRPARKAHPALLVQNLGALVRRLRDAGVDVMDAEPIPGYHHVYISDPFGNRLELMERTNTGTNVKQAVPFFGVSNIEESVRYYIDGLGFKMTNKWIDDGKLRWCLLEHGGSALMLQEYRKELVPQGKLGEGVSICFVCQDALAVYRAVKARGIKATKPFVGNGMWVTSLTDGDGYRLDFESYTDVPEETELSEDEEPAG